MQNLNLGIAKMSVIPENPLFPNPVLPKTSVYGFKKQVFGRIFFVDMNFCYGICVYNSLTSLVSLLYNDHTR